MDVQEPRFPLWWMGLGRGGWEYGGTKYGVQNTEYGGGSEVRRTLAEKLCTRYSVLGTPYSLPFFPNLCGKEHSLLQLVN